jgi:hypothetical protein
MQMNNIHEKPERSEIPRLSPDDGREEFFEAVEDHRRNDESPEDHCSNDEEQMSFHEALIIAA